MTSRDKTHDSDNDALKLVNFGNYFYVESFPEHHPESLVTEVTEPRDEDEMEESEH
ncbi:hypothetical protein GCM10011391_17520 [Pullulanibacillus camelliae]|uniref:Uncharacterized protein n=1 Tax=Pullulanibacillus camelliae TaxID=1707096 RepID=A0A8J2YD77_9BACL|nr:hypothetical protein [Pullulanibacillus camelliae]GGE39243.1 hypothetical protein GCM10011391_17520 [Pullulanibacillus camelliae]